MSSIDERVVRMILDNSQFQQDVSSTLGSVDKLSQGLKMPGASQGLDEVTAASDRSRDSLGRFSKDLKLDGATKGLEQIDAETKKISFQNLENGVQAISDKFKAMSVAGVTAIATVTQRAVSAGIQMVKSLSVDPIMQGYHEYETNLNSIQTILANTGLEGQSGLNKVNAALNELNTYSDKTIYNFSEMARNIGTFTAAGVDLKTSTAAIKGIANLAAVSGSDAQQASTAMYQLSQAIAAGKVSLEDWNSVVNAGMGGKVFQNALIQTARTHGVAIDKMIKKEGSFRMTLQKGWLTSGILTETLSKFTGDLNAQQLKSMGYTDKQAAEIIKMGKTAQDAATKVKTMSQLIDTLKEAVGSGWTQTWQILFGDFGEARDLFTDVSNVLGGFISTSSNARNKVLGDWKALGGRTVLIDSISLAFHALIAVIRPIKNAFREIFPAKTGKDLYNLTKIFHVFTENLLIGKGTADKLKRTFAGLFAIFGIVWDLVKAGAKFFFDLFKKIGQGSGGVLDFTARLGDFLVSIHDAIERGDAFTKFFDKISKIIEIPLKLLKTFADRAKGLFDKFDGKKAAKEVVDTTKKLSPLGRVIDAIAAGGDKLNDLFSSFLDHMSPIAKKLVGFFKDAATAISGLFQGLSFDSVMRTVNTGLFAGLLLLLRNFVKKFRGEDSGESGLSGLVSGIRDIFEEFTNTLKAMQTTLKATTLLEIAAAIGILTISAIALSKIDANGLKRALSAMAIMFAQLFASMAIFQKVSGGSGFGQLILVTGAMIGLAIAVDLLTIAVKQLSELDWPSLRKGLYGLLVILGGLAGATKLMSGSKGLLTTSLGMLALAGAVVILAGAVKELSGLNWKELSKGLVGVGGLLASLALFTRLASADKAGVLQGAGILLLAVGIKILAGSLQEFSKFSWKDIGKGLATLGGSLAIIGGALKLIPPSSVLSAAAVLIVASSLGLIGDAVKDMSKMNWKQIGKGLATLAGALGLIAAALYILPPSSLLSAAAILVVATSLGLITDALQQMAGMSWKEIGKSLVELAGALTIITITMIAMTEALPGAAALLVVAGSLLILAPILEAFGNMSLSEIGKSLLELAGVFAILGIAGLVLAPVTPILLALGAAITLLGIGVLAAGAGVLLFATGLTALAAAGAAGAAALVGIVKAMLGILPEVAAAIGAAVVSFAKTIGAAGPAITGAMVAILGALIDAIAKLTPKIVDTLLMLLASLLSSMLKYVPKMVDAGLKLVAGVLTGIANNVDKIVTAGTNVVVNFINSIGKNLPKVVDAGVKLIIRFVNTLSQAINAHSAEMGEAGAHLATAIVQGMVKGLASGVGTIAAEAKNAAKSALSAAGHVLGINSPSKRFFEFGMYSDQGLANGMGAFVHLVARAATAVGSKAMSALQKSVSGISDLVSTDIEMNPVITPVLDLSDVKKNSSQIGSMLQTNPISIDASYATAKLASIGYENNKLQSEQNVPQKNESTTIFNQYNNSPKALSPATIYRQTKNQLSIAKEALATK